MCTWYPKLKLWCLFRIIYISLRDSWTQVYRDCFELKCLRKCFDPASFAHIDCCQNPRGGFLVILFWSTSSYHAIMLLITMLWISVETCKLIKSAWSAHAWAPVRLVDDALLINIEIRINATTQSQARYEYNWPTVGTNFVAGGIRFPGSSSVAGVHRRRGAVPVRARDGARRSIAA